MNFDGADTTTVSFKVLPWKVPVSLPNFVPDKTRFLSFERFRYFIAWRQDTLLVFTFHKVAEECLSTQEPFRSQVIMSKENVLDILSFGCHVYIVCCSGLFQALYSEDMEFIIQSDETLGETKKLLLMDAFQLSPLKTMLAVATVPVKEHQTHSNVLAAVTFSDNGSIIDIEVHQISWGRAAVGECKLQFVQSVLYNNIPNTNSIRCFCSFLNDEQSKLFSPDLKDAHILLVGLTSGQLYHIPIFLANKNYGLWSTPKLMYQSKWPIVGFQTPSDGCGIFLFLQGGTLLYLVPHSNPLDVKITSFSYKIFSLPCTMRSFSAPKCDLIVASDGITTSLIHIVSPDKVDVHHTPLKGLVSLCRVPNTNLIIASTFHNVFYLLDPLGSMDKINTSFTAWTGVNFDESLQLVKDMKEQTKLFSLLHKELEEEDSIIKALSAVARASLLAKYFCLTAMVTKPHGSLEEFCKQGEQDMMQESSLPSYQISIEIKNESQEDFIPSLWQICVEIKYPKGISFSKNFPLSRTFTTGSPFSAVFNVPYSPKESQFPVEVKASLTAELKESGTDSQWLTIALGQVFLDISHFFLLTSQPPQLYNKNQDLKRLIKQMHIKFAEQDLLREEIREESLMANYVISVPEKFRKPNVIIEKLLTNSSHNHSKLGKDIFRQSDKTVIWITVLGNSVLLTFRKSCASIAISSTNINILHSMKLFLASIFHEDFECSKEVKAAHVKAKNLSGILEVQAIDGALDPAQLLTVYNDLRNNVSSVI